jgi:glutamine amidotransferase
MCRLLGYAGPALALDALLFTPPFSLRRQAHAPRFQEPGRINADGWGVGWYDRAIRPEPARYRTATPMWADQRFAEIAPLIHTELCIAAVRNASPGAPVEETGSSPFVSGRYLFTHNGYVDGFRQGLGVQLRRGLSERRDAGIFGAADSEVIFAMLLDRLDKGAGMDDAVAEVLGELRDLTTGRFNFLLTDGDAIVATRDGNSLFVLGGVPPAGGDGRGAVVIASEPYDDDPRWSPLADRTLTTILPDSSLTTVPL